MCSICLIATAIPRANYRVPGHNVESIQTRKSLRIRLASRPSRSIVCPDKTRCASTSLAYPIASSHMGRNATKNLSALGLPSSIHSRAGPLCICSRLSKTVWTVAIACSCSDAHSTSSIAKLTGDCMQHVLGFCKPKLRRRNHSSRSPVTSSPMNLGHALDHDITGHAALGRTSPESESCPGSTHFHGDGMKRASHDPFRSHSSFLSRFRMSCQRQICALDLTILHPDFPNRLIIFPFERIRCVLAMLSQEKDVSSIVPYVTGNSVTVEGKKTPLLERAAVNADRTAVFKVPL